MGSVVDPAYAKLGSRVTDWQDLEPGDFAFFGVPFEGLLINAVGGKGGPDGLRASLARLRPYSAELDVDFTEGASFADLGDVEAEYMDYATTFERTEAAMAAVLQRGWTPLVAGGSHSITEATLRAFSRHHDGNVGAIWLDAHPDLMDNYRGDRHYCGCPLRRMIEEGWLEPSKVAFIGLRGFANSGAEIREGRDMGIRFITMEEVADRGIVAVADEALAIAGAGTDAIYTTFDTDVLDHAVAPGTQYPCPGGLQALDAMRLVRRLALAGVAAIDFVEYAPLLDVSDATGNLLANVACEFMAGSVAARA